MRAIIAALYGLGVYAIFLCTFLYAIAFVGNLPIQKTIDSGEATPWGLALLINAGVLAVFALQHSVMARPAFKRWWTRVVPCVIERSTYVLFASAALVLLFWQWRPLPEVLWAVQDPIIAHLLQGLFWLGWLVVLVSTFLINHFELFGLHQVWAFVRGRTLPAPVFRAPSLYRYVRHPIYLGFILAFWSTPTMTAGHLLFAVATTGYILLGIWFEERDLVAQFGERYRAYREQVGMLWPKVSRRRTRGAIGGNVS